jgi:glycosyltransferase involved in cell wall biosynthesis
MVDDEAMKEEIRKMFHLIPDVISNSNWITEKLEEDGVKPFATINPGVDIKLFYPKGRDEGDDRPTVLIPLISSYPFKGFDRGVNLIKNLWKCAADKGIEIRILVYGVDNVPDLKGTATCLGPLSPTRLAKVLRTEVDVFIDPSHIHSYGMPAIEAMASGVAVVSWNNLGIKEYAKHGKTAVLFNKNENDAKIAEAAVELLTDGSKRKDLIQNAYENVTNNHDRNILVSKFIEIFENKFIPPIIPKKITFVTPHMRKHGGPTTIIDLANKLSGAGHDVSILTIYDDINPDISNRTELPIFIGAERLRPCDVLITNSDNPYNDQFSRYPDAKKKILLKMSHNDRFKELEDNSLKMNWDNIVTTTNWLKDCCEKPLEGWTHPSVPATRIGWYHYSHDLFRCPPDEKKFNDEILTIGMLVHQHPLKGSQDSVDTLVKLKSIFNTRIKVVAIGEVPAKQVQLPNWITYMPNLSREDLAGLFKKLDIWISSSHTEGLGRLALENMSASVACVLSDTQPEFGVDGENCLLFPIGNIEKAADQLTKLVQYPDLKRKIAENGFKTAELCSNPKRCIETLNAIVKA